MNGYFDLMSDPNDFSYLEGIDADTIYYHNGWSDWSWGAELIIYSKNNILYAIEDDSKPFEVTQEEAIQMMIEFDEICN